AHRAGDGDRDAGGSGRRGAVVLLLGHCRRARDSRDDGAHGALVPDGAGPDSPRRKARRGHGAVLGPGNPTYPTRRAIPDWRVLLWFEDRAGNRPRVDGGGTRCRAVHRLGMGRAGRGILEVVRTAASVL